MQSEFIFRKVVSFSGSAPVLPGMRNVYDRETGAHIGAMRSERAGDGYLLYNTDGVSLAEFDCGRTPGWVPLSQQPAARLLRRYVQQQAEVLARRTGTVSEACPNTWHNTAKYRETTACPECPSQIGLKLAIKLLRSAADVREMGGDDPQEALGYAADLEDLLYVDRDAL